MPTTHNQIAPSITPSSDPRFWAVDGSTWSYIASFVERILPYSDGCYDLEDLRQRVVSGTLVAWATEIDGEIVGVTLFSVYTHPKKRVLEVFGIAGERLEEWHDRGMRLVEEFADRVGAEHICATTHPGLARMLRRMGWKPHRELLRFK